MRELVGQRLRLLRCPGAIVAGLLASCTNPVCGCPPPDAVGRVDIRGEVLTSARDPVADAELSVPTWGYWTDPSPVDSRPDGTYSMRVSTQLGPGFWPFDLVITAPGHAPDTLHDVAATFRPMSEPPDTIMVGFTLP